MSLISADRNFGQLLMLLLVGSFETQDNFHLEPLFIVREAGFPSGFGNLKTPPCSFRLISCPSSPGAMCGFLLPRPFSSLPCLLSGWLHCVGLLKHTCSLAAYLRPVIWFCIYLGSSAILSSTCILSGSCQMSTQKLLTSTNISMVDPSPLFTACGFDSHSFLMITKLVIRFSATL